jgi:hypothetical protein
MNIMKLVTIFVYAFVGWVLCAATMGIGLATMSLQNALIIHAIGAPIFFTIVSLIYFKKFNYTTPFQTALMFVGFVIAADFFVVALVINKSLEMFASLLGTWIPPSSRRPKPLSLRPFKRRENRATEFLAEHREKVREATSHRLPEEAGHFAP